MLVTQPEPVRERAAETDSSAALLIYLLLDQAPEATMAFVGRHFRL
jgi:hypothetical protein